LPRAAGLDLVRGRSGRQPRLVADRVAMAVGGENPPGR
jgi:hypothetical protein